MEQVKKLLEKYNEVVKASSEASQYLDAIGVGWGDGRSLISRIKLLASKQTDLEGENAELEIKLRTLRDALHRVLD